MRRAIASTILAALCLTLAGAAAAAEPGTGPLTPTGLTGVWLKKDAPRDRTPMPLTPLAKAAQAKQRAEVAAGNVIGEHNRKCDPVGMPGMMTNEFALQFLEMPGRVVVVSEMSPLTRQIYLDKPQSDGGNGPMWNGHSVGHWEAKTLVVDTVNFQEPDDPIVFGGIRSASLHLVERYHLEDGGQTLIGEMTFEDPKLLTAPYTTRVAYGRLKNDSELWEYACQVDAEGWSERFKGDKAAK